jgi:predicted negative regulator of RcsB-dependent stress response
MELDEHEQGEQVQRWLRNNGSSLLTGITLGLALVFAWQWWQGKGTRHQEEAATQYHAYGQALEAKDLAKAKIFEAQLAGAYADTPYAPLAVLRQAAFLQSRNDTAGAIALLEKARPGFEHADMRELLELRLARLQLLAGKPELALKQLDAIGAKPLYPAIAAELRGDAATEQGKRDAARTAYEQALTHLDQAAPTRALLELKLIDAGGQPPAKPEA